MLAVRYDWNHIGKMPLKLGMKLYWKSFEMHQEQRAWDMWIIKYQHMDKDTFTPFEDFYQSSTEVKNQPKRKTAEELLEHAYKVRLKIAGEQKSQHSK